MASSFNPETPGVELPRDGPGALALGHASRPDRLADKRILTAVVRVVLDDRGRLVRGEVAGCPGRGVVDALSALAQVDPRDSNVIVASLQPTPSPTLRSSRIVVASHGQAGDRLR
jgi:hypothetical protein